MRNRTVRYRESESDDDDDDDEVIYVGQRSKPPTQHVVPKIAPSKDNFLVETLVLKKQCAASVDVVESQGRAIFQTLPYEVCSLSTTPPPFP